MDGFHPEARWKEEGIVVKQILIDGEIEPEKGTEFERLSHQLV